MMSPEARNRRPSADCARFRTQLVAYSRAELKGLERTLLDTHLAHCLDCRQLSDNLAQGLTAARTWQPAASPQQLTSLQCALTPYLAPPKHHYGGARRLAVLGLVVTVALAAWWAANWGVFLAKAPESALTAAESRALSPNEEAAGSRALLPNGDGAAESRALSPNEEAAGESGALLSNEVAPWLRLLSPRDWEGALSRDEQRVGVQLRAGFVAAAFRGGAGRSLRVQTPEATVRVVGTRLYVGVDASGTYVAVARGRVRVEPEGGRPHAVAAGERLWIEPSGSVPSKSPRAVPLTRAPAVMAQAEAALKDEFLRAVRHMPRPRAPAARREQTKPPPSADGAPLRPAGAPKPIRPSAPRTPPGHVQSSARSGEKRGPPPNVFALLDRAEHLAQTGQPQAALQLYRQCATRQHPAYAPFRALARYEAARLLGFALGRVPEARRRFARLFAREAGEVGWQAGLSRCELDRQRQPCRAWRCLRRMRAAARAEGRHAVAAEAEQLAGRWGLDARRCETKADEVGP